MSQQHSTEAPRSGRRNLYLAGLLALLIAGAGIGYFLWSGPESDVGTAVREGSGSPTTGSAAVMKPGPLPEKALGAENAPVTVIEYSSLTCPHCARFHTDILPKLKQDYIDKGKVKYVIREFPLDNLAATAALVARCVEGDRYFAFIDVLYAKQQQWAFGGGDARGRLLDIAKQAGIGEDKFNQCTADQQTLDKIIEVRRQGSEDFGVSSTPTFFVNGTMLKGAQSVEEFEKLMPNEVVNKAS